MSELGDRWLDLYRELRSQWVRRNGAGPTSSKTGAVLPRMRASDSLALLGFTTKGLMLWLERDSLDGKVWSSAALDSQGLVRLNKIVSPDEARALTGIDHDAGDVIPLADAVVGGNASIADYLAKFLPDSQSPYRRAPHSVLTRSTAERLAAQGALSLPRMSTYEPARTNQPAFVWAMRTAIAPWQRALNLATLQVTLGAEGPLRQLSAAEIEAIWAAIYQVMVALSASQQDVPETTGELVAGAIDAAASATQGAVTDAAEAAGKAVAWGAETLGEAAGGAASGFFSRAGFTALAVVGIALYLKFG